MYKIEKLEYRIQCGFVMHERLIWDVYLRVAVCLVCMRANISVFVNMYMYVCIYVCRNACMFVWMHIA